MAVTTEKRAVVQAARSELTPAATPAQLLQLAVQQNADIGKLEQLMALQERWEANNARKAYVAAMSEFKAEPTSILKSKRVDIQGGAKYAHATLVDVVDGVCASLSKHGLSHRWEVSQEGKSITVTCVMTHIDGHSERTTMSAPADDSGKKNPVQQIASTITYLERYTLMAATGLAARDMDNDARSVPAKAEKATAPDGYDKWAADMSALAENGEDALKKAWQGSPAAFRVYATADGSWWQDTKNKAKFAK
jgi:hypothetical protein